MRVNHVGEVCAQALYASQALATKNPQLRAHFLAASAEETESKARLMVLLRYRQRVNRVRCNKRPAQDNLGC
jgi:demethoxyubiquinone hydroxylase (CLK1/Coq7/Cat5 family)